jgi:hypothetical protein
MPPWSEIQIEVDHLIFSLSLSLSLQCTLICRTFTPICKICLDGGDWWRKYHTLFRSLVLDIHFRANKKVVCIHTSDACASFKYPKTHHFVKGQGLVFPLYMSLSTCMKWLRYQRVISLKIQVGNTNQRNRWANTDHKIYWRWDQVPRGSKHPLLIDHTRREPSSKIMNAELFAVKVSSTV